MVFFAALHELCQFISLEGKYFGGTVMDGAYVYGPQGDGRAQIARTGHIDECLASLPEKEYINLCE